LDNLNKSESSTESSTANIIYTTDNKQNNMDLQDKKSKKNKNMIDMIKVKKTTNNLKLFVHTGNYQIENLLNFLNKQLNKYEIEMNLCLTTNLISFKSKKQFSLELGASTMFENLGFSKKSLYTNSKKYIGSKPYNFKSDRCYNIYLFNIDTKKPIMQYIIGQSNSKKIIFNQMLPKLSDLNVKFFDSKNKEFKFDSENGLDFGFKINLKLLNSQPKIIENENSTNNESENILSDDVYTLVCNAI
jgi:hypothetical protein